MAALRCLALLGLLLLQPALAAGEVGSVVVYSSAEDYETVRDNLEFAITEQGLVVNNIMHIGEMLERTGKDLGYEQIYQQAESFSFCSAKHSHAMMAVDARNITVCPYTISVYVNVAEPDKVYVAYNKPVLTGDSTEITAEIIELLDEIAQAAVSE